MLKLIVLLSILCLSFGGAAQNSLPKELTFSYIESDESQLAAARAISIAYARLGIKINLLALPAKRALYQSDSGQVDGEIIRISGVQDVYPNLLAVPVSLFLLDGMAYTIKAPREFSNITDILRSRIAIHRGMIWQETFIENGLGFYTQVNSEASLLKLLVTNRVDYVLIERTRGTKLINTEFSAYQIVEVSPAITQTSLFHFLNRKHQALIPLITKQLERMQASGELAKIWQLRADSH